MVGQRRDNTLTGLGTERKPRFGRYQVVRKISEGATSAIFLAKTDHPAGFAKTAALKVMRPELLEDPRRVQTFLQEAKISARINHANVCSVFDFGEDNGYYYIAMEYLVGETLTKIFEATRNQGLGREAATHRMVSRIIAHACEGLHAAHELTDGTGKPLHVVHRDVCPDNIIVTYDGQVSVVDFGLARAALQDGDFDVLAKTDHLAYLAPEQARGRELDRRADIWSLGAILWEGLAGRRLFDGGTRNEIVFQMASQQIASPEEVQWPVADVFAQCALRALNRDVDGRYVDARTMGERLELALQATGNALGASAISAWMHAIFPGQAERKKLLLSSLPPPVPADARHPLYDEEASKAKTAVSVDTPPKREESTTRRERVPTDTRVGAPDLLETKALDVRGMVAPSPRKRNLTPEDDDFDDPDTSTFAGLGSNPPSQPANRDRRTRSLSQGLRSSAGAVGHDEEVETVENVAQVPLRPPETQPKPSSAARAMPAPPSRAMPGVPSDSYEVVRPVRRTSPWVIFVVFVALGAVLAIFRRDIEQLFTGASQDDAQSVDANAQLEESGSAAEPAVAGSDAGGLAAGSLDASSPDAKTDRRDASSDARLQVAKSGEPDASQDVPSRAARPSRGRDWIVDPSSVDPSSVDPSSKATRAGDKPRSEPSGERKQDWIVDPESGEPDEPTKPEPGGIDWIID